MGMSDPGPVLPPAPAAIVPPADNVFRGPNGIRAGWRALIFLAIVAGLLMAVAVVVGMTLRFTHGGSARFNVSPSTPLGLGLSEAVFLLLPTVIAALIMAKIEHRKFSVYGLPAKFALRKNFWIGTLAGFAAISTSLLGIFILHGFHLTGFAIHGQTILTAIASWSVAFAIVGLAEEFSFRGYLQFTLTTGIGFWPSAFLLSALFGLAHAGNPGESKAGLLSVVCFGLLFCLFLRRTGNLWWAVGFHAGWDWGQTFSMACATAASPRITAY
jgi:hypothetical protein